MFTPGEPLVGYTRHRHDNLPASEDCDTRVEKFTYPQAFPDVRPLEQGYLPLLSSAFSSRLSAILVSEHSLGFVYKVG